MTSTYGQQWSRGLRGETRAWLRTASVVVVAGY